jgi:hypothetical protein
MIRHNGTMLGVRVMTVPSVELGGRTHCRECDVMLPRGADRPFCVDHSPYVARLRREIERQEGTAAAA